MRDVNDKGRAPEPHEVLGAGQSVKVKVMSVDAQRNRIGLALVS
jgi:ribosomal protein S1